MRLFKYIEREINVFEQFLDRFGGEVIPCKNEEIEILESLIPKPYFLPEAYKEFLLYGGKKMAGLFDKYEAGYEAVKKIQLTRNQEIIRMVKAYDPEKKELPVDLFVIEEINHCNNFTYLLLKEGNNPPVYFWEEDEGGLEVSIKLADSFSNYLLREIQAKATSLAHRLTGNQTEAGKAPRGKQFWIPEAEEYSQGVEESKLMDRLGFYGRDMHQALTITRLDYYSYLEELSGWKARQVGDEVRFFPPSYKSPEEKALERKNQIESKKQELAKVEKIIANLQNRIKNLSGGKLTGGRSINFNNSLALRIKELEQDLRKQKVNKRKLEKDIRSLEEDSK